MADFTPPPLSSREPDAFVPPPLSSREPDSAGSRFVEGVRTGSSTVGALADIPGTLKGLTGIDQVQSAMESHDQGDKQGAALKLLKWVGSNPATKMADQMIQTSKDQFGKAWDAYKAGDYSRAVLHVNAGVVPLIVPAVADAADEARKGNYAGAAGKVTGAGIDLATPKAIEKMAPVVNAAGAGVKAAAPDLAAGTAKTAAGVGTAYVGSHAPGLEPIVGGITGATLGGPLVTRGAAQIGEGIRKGFTAARESLNPPPPPAPPPPGTATSADLLRARPSRAPIPNAPPVAPIQDLRVPPAGPPPVPTSTATSPVVFLARKPSAPLPNAPPLAPIQDLRVPQGAQVEAPVVDPAAVLRDGMAQGYGYRNFASIRDPNVARTMAKLAEQQAARDAGAAPPSAGPPATAPPPAPPPAVPPPPATPGPAAPATAADFSGGPSRSLSQQVDDYNAAQRAQAPQQAAPPPVPAPAPEPSPEVPPEPPTAPAPAPVPPSPAPAPPPTPQADPGLMATPGELAYRAARKASADAKDVVVAKWLHERGMTPEDIKPDQAFADLVDKIPNPNAKSGKFSKTDITRADYPDRLKSLADTLKRHQAQASDGAITADATKVAQFLYDGGVTHMDAAPMGQEQFDMAAQGAGVQLPAGTRAQAEILFQLKKMELARAPGATLGDRNATPANRGQAGSPADQQATGAQPASIPAAPADARGRSGGLEARTEPDQPDPGAARGVRGNDTIVKLPNGGRLQARYEVGELADSQASHNGQTFQPNPKYGLKNDRNYDNRVNQQKIVTNSSADPQTGFDPRHVINNSPTATSGPWLEDTQGNVVSGNGRRMTVGRVADRGGLGQYRGLLDQEAPQYGIDPASYAHMKAPTLKIVAEDAAFEKAGGKQAVISDTNKGESAALTPSEQSVADSRRVSASTLDDIARRLEDKGPTSTLAQILEGTSGLEVLDRLVKDGVVASTERAQLQSADALTKAGKARVSSLMLGRFFEDPKQMDSIKPAIRAKLERMAAPLAKVEGGEFNLSPKFQKALTLIENAQAHGSNIADFLKQSGLFAKEAYPAEVADFAKQLQTRPATALTQAVRDYAEKAKYSADYQGPGMFGEFPEPVKPAQAFEESFGKKAMSDEAFAKSQAKNAKAKTAAKYAP